MATLQDIASCVGVDSSTVSRVVNGRPEARVRDEVRRRILEAARELGYRPNAYARGLARGRGSQVTLVFWTAASHYSSRRVRMIEGLLATPERPVMSIDAASLPRSRPQLLQDVLGSQLPEAVVFVGGSMPAEEISEVVRSLHKGGVHCVIADLPWDVAPDVPCDTVRADRIQGAMLPVNHLLELGHRHIGFVSQVRLTGRLAGYEQALAARGIAERYVAPLEPEASHGDYAVLGPPAREQTRALLERHPQISALVCGTDVLALAAMQALHSLGLRVPEDVSVVGYDNDPWTEFLPLPLTTVEHPLDEISRVVKEILSARLGGDRGPWRRVELDYRLIVRASTAATDVRGREAETTSGGSRESSP
ncbi:MAG: LacI family DNA-binding transcriptional regulator [Armatimonadota bacterium]